MINTYPLLVGGPSNRIACLINDGRPFVMAYPPITEARYPGDWMPETAELIRYGARKFRDSRLNFGDTTFFMYCHESVSDDAALAIFKHWKKL